MKQISAVIAAPSDIWKDVTWQITVALSRHLCFQDLTFGRPGEHHKLVYTPKHRARQRRNMSDYVDTVGKHNGKLDM